MLDMARRKSPMPSESRLPILPALITAVFEAKATLGESLARITPGDLNLLPLSVRSEANENAYKMAHFGGSTEGHCSTARSGSSMGALSLTGDPRRWPLEPGLGGVLRTEDPYWYRCPLRSTPEAQTLRRPS